MSKPSLLPSIEQAKFIEADALMGQLGYKNRQAFYDFARRTGLPIIRLSGRRFVFEQTSVNRWLESRVIGKIPSNPGLN